MKKSVVIPFHDGERYLKYSLPPLAKLPVDEFVIIFDRVSDNLRTLFEFYFPKSQRHKCKFIIRRTPSKVNCKTVGLDDDHLKDWTYDRAKIFSMGLRLAEGDLLFVSAEDIVLDPCNFDEEYWMDKGVGMVDFRYLNYEPRGLNLRNAWLWNLTKFVDRFGRRGATQESGIYGVRKSVYEQIGGLEDVPTEEDWLRRRVKESGFKHVHVTRNKGNIHLRTSQDKERQLMQGKTRFLQGQGLVKVLGHGLLYFKPYVILGYVQEMLRVC